MFDLFCALAGIEDASISFGPVEGMGCPFDCHHSDFYSMLFPHVFTLVWMLLFWWLLTSAWDLSF